jgi:tetratricopeptide (TPR) repeat protein
MESFDNPVGALFAAQLKEGAVRSANREREGRDADESRMLGAQSLDEGDFEDAIRHFRRAVEQIDQDRPEARQDLAAALLLGDQSPAALRQYALALQVRNDAESRIGLAEVYTRHGRYRDATAQLEEAVRLDPENAYHHHKLAEKLREMGERKRALISAQLAVANKPDDAFYHYWTADLQLEMGRNQEALDSIRGAIELSPGDDFLYLRAAVAFWRVDRKLDAIKAVRLASELDPDKHLYHGLLGILLEADGQLDEAVLESSRAEKMDRYDHDRLARIASELGLEDFLPEPDED